MSWKLVVCIIEKFVEEREKLVVVVGKRWVKKRMEFNSILCDHNEFQKTEP